MEKDNKSKFSKEIFKEWQFGVVVVLVVIVVLAVLFGLLICLDCFNALKNQNTAKTLWVTFLCAVAGAGASLLVGLIAFWQNKRMKQLADAKDAFTRQENEKQRKQDLLIKTNPKAAFDKIDRITYCADTCCIITDREKINRLTDVTFNGRATFSKELNMDLIFDVNANVDSIHVYELEIFKTDELCWTSKSQTFINPSKTPYGALKVIGNNKIKLFIQLLWNKNMGKDILQEEEKFALEYMNEPNIIWMIILKYKVKNDFSGANNLYQTQFYFKNLSGSKSNVIAGIFEEQPLDIEMIEDKTTTWIIKEETQNGQAEDDVDGQGE